MFPKVGSKKKTEGVILVSPAGGPPVRHLPLHEVCTTKTNTFPERNHRLLFTFNYLAAAI